MRLSGQKIVFMGLGILTGIIFTSAAGFKAYEILKGREISLGLKFPGLPHFPQIPALQNTVQVEETFLKPFAVQPGKPFGKANQLMFELYRGGTFVIDGQSGYAWQQSSHYGDVALIRSAKELPKNYKISAIVGDIDYGLQHIQGLKKDPEYREGPPNENGCYLLTITDEDPSGHHENSWWHEHRKVVIDVDNNVWGIGSPRPIFMVYFNNDNQLMAFDDTTQKWQTDWRKAATYEVGSWYRVEIERTNREFILRVFDASEKSLNEAKVPLSEVWHADSPEYFVIGDPHENYYQGSMKIKSITMPVKM